MSMFSPYHNIVMIMADVSFFKSAFLTNKCNMQYVCGAKLEFLSAGSSWLDKKKKVPIWLSFPRCVFSFYLFTVVKVPPVCVVVAVSPRSLLSVVGLPQATLPNTCIHSS